MNNKKFISVLMISFICISTFFIAINTTQSIKSPTIDNNKIDSVNLDLQSSSSEQKVTLIVGSNEDAVNKGILTFQENLNNEIEINKQSTIITADNTEILVIFSHGTEKGMILNGELISWYNLSILIGQTKAKSIFLATCYGANIYPFTDTINKLIIGFNGIVDAILMGYSFAMLANARFNYLDDARNNAESMLQRLSLILEQPEQYLPLFYSECHGGGISFLGIVLYYSITLQFKLTPQETTNWEVGTFGASLIGLAVGGIPGDILAALGLLLESMILPSRINHPDGGAWISIESVIWPFLGIFLQARASSGAIVYQIPITFSDPVSSTIVTAAFNANIHGWTWH